MSTQVEEEKKQEVNKEPEIKSNWTTKERWAAQQALNNALDILDEYDY